MAESINLLQRSFSASVMILVIIACRILLINKVPKRVFLVLWYIVLFRLLIPYSFPSIFGMDSLIRQELSDISRIKHTEEQKSYEEGGEIQKQKEQQKDSIIKNADNVSVNRLWKIIWPVGMGICAFVFLTAYRICRQKFKYSLPVENPVAEKWLKSHKIKRKISIRQTEGILSPLTYGIFCPVILMPKKTEWENVSQIEYILEHEFIHIRRLDAATKLCFVTAVCIYWFHPLIWVMYLLVNRDIELSCDEAVIRHFGENSRAAYAFVLIGMEEVKSGMVPLGSGFKKNTAEERITAIMKMKKNSAASHITAAFLVIMVIIVFAALPTAVKESEKGGFDKKTEEQNKDENKEKDEKKKIETEKEDSLYDSVLGEIAAGIAEKGDYEVLKDIIYFLSKKDADKIAEQIAENGDQEELNYLFPYTGKEPFEGTEKRWGKQEWGNIG